MAGSAIGMCVSLNGPADPFAQNTQSPWCSAGIVPVPLGVLAISVGRRGIVAQVLERGPQHLRMTIGAATMCIPTIASIMVFVPLGTQSSGSLVS